MQGGAHRPLRHQRRLLSVRDKGHHVGSHLRDRHDGGICHNDTGCAVANSISAVEAGARHVQGTFLIRARCGNANLSTIIEPAAQTRYKCLPDPSMAQLTSTARYIAEISNILVLVMSLCGNSAFAHKAGMYADGVAYRVFRACRPGSRREPIAGSLYRNGGQDFDNGETQDGLPGPLQDSPETRAIIENP